MLDIFHLNGSVPGFPPGQLPARRTYRPEAGFKGFNRFKLPKILIENRNASGVILSCFRQDKPSEFRALKKPQTDEWEVLRQVLL